MQLFIRYFQIDFSMEILSNDNAQKLARGNTPYEFYNNWYSIPEDPTLEFITNADGITNS